jgi:1-acyl-sn-glycerol-3-phosphate acyltransferase
MLYAFGKTVTYWLVRILFKMRYEGLENIPAGSGFILASNHRTYLDPLFIAHKLPCPVHYMAKAELFTAPILGFLVKRLKAFPVSRGSGDRTPLDTAVAFIKGGEVMGMFPEGTRSRDGKPMRPHSGVALIAAETGADVLPCAIVFEGKLRFRTPVTVRYGKLITSEELAADPASRTAIRTASKRIMEGIVGLLEAGRS